MAGIHAAVRAVQKKFGVSEPDRKTTRTFSGQEYIRRSEVHTGAGPGVKGNIKLARTKAQKVAEEFQRRGFKTRIVCSKTTTGDAMCSVYTRRK